MTDTSSERYTLGYGESSMDWMASRTAAGHGAFFLPYLKPGMNLLDCGCGPGTLTLGFAQRIFPGQATGIDREISQTAPVRAEAEQNSITNLDFAEGDIYVLPCPDNQFDAVFGSAVLGSVADAAAVVREMVRVLKPGGVIGLKEFDHGADIIWPQTPLIEKSIELYQRIRKENNHENLAGRRLREFISANGCTVEHTGAYFDQHSGLADLQPYIERNNALVDEILASQYIELGWCSAAEIEQQAEEWREFAANPAAIYASAWLEAVGRKPA